MLGDQPSTFRAVERDGDNLDRELQRHLGQGLFGRVAKVARRRRHHHDTWHGHLHWTHGPSHLVLTLAPTRENVVVETMLTPAFHATGRDPINIR